MARVKLRCIMECPGSKAAIGKKVYWNNFVLRQDNFWLSKKFTLQKYIAHIFISS